MPGSQGILKIVRFFFCFLSGQSCSMLLCSAMPKQASQSRPVCHLYKAIHFCIFVQPTKLSIGSLGNYPRRPLNGGQRRQNVGGVLLIVTHTEAAGDVYTFQTLALLQKSGQSCHPFMFRDLFIESNLS